MNHRPNPGVSRVAMGAAHREHHHRAAAIAGLLLGIGLCIAGRGVMFASVARPKGSVNAHGAMLAQEYVWVAPVAQSVNSLGEIDLRGTGQSAGVELLRPSIHGRGGHLVCLSTAWDASGKQLRITYTIAKTLVHVTVTTAVDGVAFVATIDADQPAIDGIDFGPWLAPLKTRPVIVPYYGNVWYLPGMTEYGNAWWDWHATQATRINGTGAQYLARTDSTLSRLHERLSVVLSPDVDMVLPSLGNSASPYVRQLAGKMVLDIWTVGFKQIEKGLLELGDYGITDCVGIIHAWQHAGYDNGLPQHYPANAAMGGDTGLVDAINAGKADGCRMALHENYVDYYPNYANFDPSAVALNGDGGRMLSWLNHSTNTQSYSTKPAWMAKNASTQSPVIHARYGTTAAYLDVNSGISFSSHGDMDARASGGGTLVAWFAGDTALWSYERKIHQGPVLGEGGYHWYYSGLLDGVEAQFATGSNLQDAGTQAPLFVDFDLERIHPLQVNHGMGYYKRWLAPGEKSSDTLTMDAYRMQEIAFGHAPFLGAEYWNDIAHAFVESNLIGPVAKSYGAALVSSIEYQVNDVWESPSIAARSMAFSRVQIVYDNGLTVVANAGREPLLWQGIRLPQYGWAAKGHGLLAYTAMCGSTVCDYAETSTSVFANARNQADMQIGNAPASPAIASAGQGGGGSLTDPRLNRAGTVLNFGSLQTDGMISIREEKGRWVLRPFPRSRSFTVLLQKARFPIPANVQPDGGSTPLLKPLAQGAYWRLPLTGAKSYSWPANQKKIAALRTDTWETGKNDHLEAARCSLGWFTTAHAPGDTGSDFALEMRPID